MFSRPPSARHSIRATSRAAFDKITAARRSAGHWTPNELRHSAASLLSAAGVPLEEIADVLGHTSTRMLEQHYRHQVKPSIDAHVGGDGISVRLTLLRVRHPIRHPNLDFGLPAGAVTG